MKALIAILAALALTGCASTDSLKSQALSANIEIAKKRADAAAQAMLNASIPIPGCNAPVGTDFKTSCVMTIVVHAPQDGSSSGQVAMPRSAGDSALAWASILVPSLTQGYGMFSGTKLGMRQSDNATVLGVSTNETFLGMAGQIQSPAPNMTIGGSGVIGSGSYTTIDNSYNPSPIADSYNPIDNSSQPVDNSVTYPPAP